MLAQGLYVFKQVAAIPHGRVSPGRKVITPSTVKPQPCGGRMAPSYQEHLTTLQLDCLGTSPYITRPQRVSQRTAPSVLMICPARWRAPCSKSPEPSTSSTTPNAIEPFGAGSNGRFGAAGLLCKRGPYRLYFYKFPIILELSS